MRIGVLTHNYPRFAGDFSGIFIEQLCQELARQGDEVHVIAPYDPAYSLHGQQGANPRLHLYRYAWPDRAHLLGYMRTMQADLRMRLHTYALSPLLFARGGQFTRQVARQERIQLLHAHWVLPNGYMAAAASRSSGIPLVVSIPGSDALVADQNPLFRRMARSAFAQAGLITANSRQLRDVAVRRLGADTSRFELIVYGVDPDRLRPDPTGTQELRAALGIPAAAFVLLAVGRMVYKKGFDVLLRALAELPPAVPADLPDIHTVLVGDGDLWAEWQQLAHSLGLANVHWVGRAPTHEIGRYYNVADALVMPSVARPADGLNVCVLDAMACAKPIVASDCAGNDLVVTEGVNGHIVPEGDAQALAAAIAGLAAQPERGRQMGVAGRRLIETQFGWPHLARRYRQHYRALTGHPD